MMVVMCMISMMVVMMVCRSSALLRTIRICRELQRTETASWMMCVFIMVMMVVMMRVGMLVMVMMMCGMTSFGPLAGLLTRRGGILAIDTVVVFISTACPSFRGSTICCMVFFGRLYHFGVFAKSWTRP